MKALYKASIFHKRFTPRVNEFTYQGLYVRFDIEELSNLKTKLFSINKFNLLSFFNKDHGYRDHRSLKSWAIDIINRSGIDSSVINRIELSTFPRILGYVFNPVSFWHCYHDQKLIAIICEVNNTFGESHNYVLNKAKQTLPKKFHVSPFFEVRGHYDFDFSHQDIAIINHTDGEKTLLSTSIKGEPLEWNDKNIFSLFIKNPFYTFFVVFLIHYQALKLFIKKIKFYTKPQKPNTEITYEHQSRKS